MIVTVANCASEDGAGQLAEQLAVLRARSGRKVLLLDASAHQCCRPWALEREHLHAGPALVARAVGAYGLPEELERLYPRFADAVIDADCGNGHECRSALIMAQAAVVPLSAAQADPDAGYALIARINAARMFNPGLRVLFVAACGAQGLAPGELGALRGYAAQVMGAGLAATVLRLPDACDSESSSGAAVMAALYREVYQASPVPARIAAGQFP